MHMVKVELIDLNGEIGNDQRFQYGMGRDENYRRREAIENLPRDLKAYYMHDYAYFDSDDVFVLPQVGYSVATVKELCSGILSVPIRDDLEGSVTEEITATSLSITFQCKGTKYKIFKHFAGEPVEDRVEEEQPSQGSQPVKRLSIVEMVRNYFNFNKTAKKIKN